ncbi:MAG: RNA-binding cell elongation regulator Jag/EloR [Acidimicrobiia bacterium]|nr:RNA-binding cell elongation regulator Jag/EloR [Acidimicrobiia bacterium]
MEWVEAVGKTVDEAVDAAMSALGETSKDAVNIEVVDEGKKGLLGLGGREAKVKVTVKPKKKRRRRTKGRKPQNGQSKSGDGKSRKAKGGKPNGSQQRRKGPKDSRDRGPKEKKPTAANGSVEKKKVVVDKKPEDKADIEEQAQVAREFAEGLLEAFGLDGVVETRVEDDILYVDINGEQTEALVGRKGAVVQAVHELTRTVIQRKTFGAPRMRLDIAGYAARRREALKIYAGRLAETVIEDGREAMLEPMNAADRKVVHDAIAEIDGVRSFSEGEEPNRSVVVAPAD